MRIDSVSTLDALEPHAAAWDALAERCPQRMPMLSHAWVAPHLEHTPGGPRRWRCFLAYEGERLRGVLPVLLVPARGLSARRPRLRVPCFFHTDDGDIPLDPETAAEALPALVEAAWEAEPRAFSLEFGGVRDGSPTLGALGGAGRGASVLTTVEAHGSSFPISGTRDAWWSGLSKNLRSDLKRLANRFTGAGAPHLEVRFLSGAEAGPERLDAFVALEASGWKGRDGTAIGCSPASLAAWREVVRRLHARGWLEWHELAIDGRTAASHLACRFGRAVVVMKLAYDETASQHSPGSLLLLRTIEREFASGASDEVNFTTDYGWLRRWRTTVTPYHRARLYPASPLPTLLGAWPIRAREALKRSPRLVRLVKRMRGEAVEP